ncbi:MAG TPA: hypothetical protein DCZ69_19615 [Syntrophobacteraceae bacterium]|nr:hypothetical protein [Syntrophobacteraceae bacterium]
MDDFHNTSSTDDSALCRFVLFLADGPVPESSIRRHEEACDNQKEVQDGEHAQSKVFHKPKADAHERYPGSNEGKAGPGAGIDGSIAAEHGALSRQRRSFVSEVGAHLVVQGWFNENAAVGQHVRQPCQHGPLGSMFRRFGVNELIILQNIQSCCGNFDQGLMPGRAHDARLDPPIAVQAKKNRGKACKNHHPVKWCQQVGLA